MRNPERIDEFCEELAKLWHKNPDLRFGQIIESVTTINGIRNMFYIEDDKMLDMLREYLGEK